MRRTLICQTTPLAGGARFDAVLKKPDRTYYWDVATFAVKYDGTAVAGKRSGSTPGTASTRSGHLGQEDRRSAGSPQHTALQVVELTDRWAPTGGWVGRAAGAVGAGALGYTTIDDTNTTSMFWTRRR
jgi:hypothetical protein